MKRLIISLLIFFLLVIPLLAWGMGKLFSKKIHKIVHALPRSGTNSYTTRNVLFISEIVIHHSGVDGQGPYDYARYHINHHGWPGIGYHYVIQPNGRIYQTNEHKIVSYHVENHNSKTIGICLSGNLNEHPMSEAQARSLTYLIRKLKADLPQHLAVSGHRDHKNTSCPGSYTTEFVNHLKGEQA